MIKRLIHKYVRWFAAAHSTDENQMFAQFFRANDYYCCNNEHEARNSDHARIFAHGRQRVFKFDRDELPIHPPHESLSGWLSVRVIQLACP